MCILGIFFGFMAESVLAQGRLIRRVQERTEQRIVNEIFGEEEKKDHGKAGEHSRYEREGGQNRRGAGLDRAAPDVAQNIMDAGEALGSSDYMMAKNAIKNALWGVELEIGQRVLEKLPQTVKGMPHDETDDRVSSTGAGFMGLIIERRYKGDEGMQVRTTIGNDAMLLGIAGLYLADGYFVHEHDDPSRKQIRFKEHRAVIQYDDYDGYTLSVPFGQSSVILINGVNFENETQFMAAANEFDLEIIKKELGEL